MFCCQAQRTNRARIRPVADEEPMMRRCLKAIEYKNNLARALDAIAVRALLLWL